MHVTAGSVPVCAGLPLGCARMIAPCSHPQQQCPPPPFVRLHVTSTSRSWNPVSRSRSALRHDLITIGAETGPLSVGALPRRWWGHGRDHEVRSNLFIPRCTRQAPRPRVPHYAMKSAPCRGWRSSRERFLASRMAAGRRFKVPHPTRSKWTINMSTPCYCLAASLPSRQPSS